MRTKRRFSPGCNSLQPAVANTRHGCSRCSAATTTINVNAAAKRLSSGQRHVNGKQAWLFLVLASAFRVGAELAGC
jgi:hypothetical protein